MRVFLAVWIVDKYYDEMTNLKHGSLDELCLLKVPVG